MQEEIWTREKLVQLKPAPADNRIYCQVKEIWDKVAKPLDGLGRFEEFIAQIGAVTGSTEIDIRKKAVITMCADNGIVEEGVSQSGQEVTRLVAVSMGRQESSVGKMAACVGADVIPVDIGINSDEKISGVRDCKVRKGTRNFLKEPAMTEAETLEAVSVGIRLCRECREKGFCLLGTGEMGIGNTTTGSAVTAALTGCDAQTVTGRGAGLSDVGLERKREVIAQALAKYPVKTMDALQILSVFGGLDIAGMAGVCIGGAIYHIPVVLDGVISMAAALAAEQMVPGVRAYLLPSHMSREPAAEKIAAELGLYPVIDAGLALGEGTGAVMMFQLLDTALALYQSRTTFDKIELEQYQRLS